MLAVVTASLLAAVAIPSYDQFVDRAKNAKAVEDIVSISKEIDRFRLKNNEQFPAVLNELPIEIPKDPWGAQYHYIITGTTGPGEDAVRKNGKHSPLNSDFDLYSMGADGDSDGALSARTSRDDIVRANNGAFIGLGEDY